MHRSQSRLIISIATAALLWFYMFSPWTGSLSNFWLNMSISALILSSMAFMWSGNRPSPFSVKNAAVQIAAGLVIAFALWGIFQVGDFLSQLMFSFARGQVDSVYAMKDGSNPLIISLLLIFLIGPAEEFFWRGYVQKTLSEQIGGNSALAVTTIIYALVHIWSFNFMLIMAALVAGSVWGLIYRLKPSLLPATIISHAVWDALVFVILPI